MIVSDRKRFVFIHNPKAGGTTVRRHIEAYDDAAPQFWNFAMNWRLGRKVDKAHLPLEDIKRGYPETYEKLQDYWTFVIVRNPYARTVSAFAQWCLKQEGARLDDRHWARVNFRDYVQALDARRVRKDLVWIHACPQHLYVTVRDQRVCDFVGKLERLNDDLGYVSTHLGLDLSAPMEKINASSDRRGDCERRRGGDAMDGVAHWYDGASARKVEQFYARDFELLDYPLAS